jgi:hypothetical protein
MYSFDVICELGDGAAVQGMLSAVYPEASSSDLDKCLEVVHSIKEVGASLTVNALILSKG